MANRLRWLILGFQKDLVLNNGDETFVGHSSRLKADWLSDIQQITRGTVTYRKRGGGDPSSVTILRNLRYVRVFCRKGRESTQSQTEETIRKTELLLQIGLDWNLT